jgi:hypothetical protein
MRLVNVLHGEMAEPNGFWFCDWREKEPEPLLASETYVMALNAMPLSNFSGFEADQGLFYHSILADNVFEGSDSEAGHEAVSEGFYETPHGRRWLGLAEALGKLEKTVPVVPTDSTGLLMEFYNGNAWVDAGRDISEEEYLEGASVCLVPETFARRNGLSVGDSFRAPLYFADYANSLIDFEHHVPFSLLNSDGESFEVFEETAYEIVGLYRHTAATYSPSEFLLAENTVIVPAASVKNSDAGNIAADGPMQHHNTSFQIPNGTIESWLEEWGGRRAPAAWRSISTTRISRCCSRTLTRRSRRRRCCSRAGWSRRC